MTQTHKQKVGGIGEDLAYRFLVKQGFIVLDRNYLKKWGELDIITKKDGVLRFIEVKTVSRENIKNISLEVLEQDKPEENVHAWKLKRLYKTINSYLLEKYPRQLDKSIGVIHETHSIDDQVDWQFDIVVVFLDLRNKQAKIRFTENVIL